MLCSQVWPQGFLPYEHKHGRKVGEPQLAVDPPAIARPDQLPPLPGKGSMRARTIASPARIFVLAFSIAFLSSFLGDGWIQVEGRGKLASRSRYTRQLAPNRWRSLGW